eukprot:m.1260509 g.1260509  ORF g.1260509 m.1260509 type:complete len:169 (+) comp24727_c0_seq12:1563-2069(+)
MQERWQRERRFWKAREAELLAQMESQSRSYSMVRQIANEVLDPTTIAADPGAEATAPSAVRSPAPATPGDDVSPLLKAHLRRRSRVPPDAPAASYTDNSDDDDDDTDDDDDADVAGAWWTDATRAADGLRARSLQWVSHAVAGWGQLLSASVPHPASGVCGQHVSLRV